MFSLSACQERMGSARLRSTGFAPTSAITDIIMVLFDGVLQPSVASLHCGGVPHCSVLGPLLLLLYTADVGELVVSLGLQSSHVYADDSQLYVWCPPSTVAQQRLRIERISEWMRSNRLRLSPENRGGLR